MTGIRDYAEASAKQANFENRKERGGEPDRPDKDFERQRVDHADKEAEE